MDEMYEAWAKDPKSVHPSWDAYFKGVQYMAPPSLGLTKSNEIPLSALAPAFAAQSAAMAGQPQGASSTHLPSSKIIDAHVSVQASIRWVFERFFRSFVNDITYTVFGPFKEHFLGTFLTPIPHFLGGSAGLNTKLL